MVRWILINIYKELNCVIKNNLDLFLNSSQIQSRHSIYNWPETLKWIQKKGLA